MTRLPPIRRFLADDRGTATIEFLFVIPVFVTIFMASVEASLYTLRSVLLERSVDIVVRDIRLGLLDGLTHTQLKERICQTGALVQSVPDCVAAMRIWMQPVDTATFAMVAPPRHCVDRNAPIDPFDPLNNPGADEFRFGADNEIMLLRICLKEVPMFPSSAVAANMIAGGEGDGAYALIATSVFVNEPG